MFGAYPLAAVPIAALARADQRATPDLASLLLADRYAPRLHTIEVAPLDPVTHAPVPLFWADKSYTTEPTDVPANQHFQGRVHQAFTFAQRLPRDQLLGGGTTSASASAGEITVSLGDGRLDALLDHIWEGQPLTVKAGLPGMPYAQFATLFTGIIQTKPTATRTEMTLRLRDPQEILQKPIQTETYAGTGGLEGTAENKGQTKPLAYGDLTGVPAVQLDPTNLVYQWSASAVLQVIRVRDRGVPLTEVSAFQSEPPGLADAGTYIANLSNGTIRLGGAPTGQITVDGRGKFVGAAATLLRQMLQERLPDLPLDVASFVRAAPSGSPLAYAYLPGQETWASLWPKLFAGRGSVLVANRLGQMTVVTPDPGATPTATIPADRILDEGISIEALPNPAWRLRWEFQHNWAPIPENVSAGDLDPVVKAALARAFREEELRDEAVRTLFPLAEDPDPIVAYLTGLHFGDMERLLALVSGPRRLYRVPLYGRPFTMTLGQPVLLPASRPLAHEKRGVLLTIEEDAQTNVVTLEVLV